MTPKFTVIVPTRERADVLASALATVTAQDYDALEILVSDNASADATRDVAMATGDPRVRYLNTGRRLSMRGNYEFALSHVTEGWVGILGDDDGLLPGALARVASLAAATGVSAVRSSLGQFLWPSHLGEPDGRLELPMARGWEVRDGREYLRRVMRGEVSYLELPQIYTGGFVSLALVDRIRRAGHVFGSCIPDVYTSVAFASVLGPYVYCREPLAINGASRHSIGAAYFHDESSAAAAPVRVFREEEALPMHAAIPYTDRGGYPQSVHALVYECYLQTAWLRPQEPSRHADQLELVLAMIDGNATAITSWAQRFAALHGLDYGSALQRARGRRNRIRLRRLPARIRAGAVHIVDARTSPLRDIYDATQMGAGVYRLAPSLRSRATDSVTSLRGFVRRQLVRIRG